MMWVDKRERHLLPKGLIYTALICFVCLCVLSQMLGAPVTLLSLLTSDTPVELLSEDFSILPLTPVPVAPSRSTSYAEFEPSFHIPIFSISVFHPPQG